jgi:hypothetical protein
MCKDCKIINFDGEFGLEELSKEIEDVLPIIRDALEYLIFKNFDLLLKAKSPYFRLLLQIYKQQFDTSLLLYEKFKGRAK